MWKDDNDKIMEISNLLSKDDIFPKKCPICGEKDAHIFFYKKEGSKLGSLWEWCSKCKNYSHSRYLIPDWWINNNKIEIDSIELDLDYLDNNKAEIDNWVNELLKNK